MRCHGAGSCVASVLKDFCGIARKIGFTVMAAKNEKTRFQNRPNQDDLPQSWKILRATKKGTQRVMMLADDCVGCYVHYWHGRTRPCYRNDCEPCGMGQRPRWRGYIPVWTPAPSVGKLLEITPSVVADFDRWIQTEGTLRGASVKLSRKGNVPNGELQCDIAKPTGFAVNLPPCPNTMQLLARIWKLTHAPLPSEIAADHCADLQRGSTLGRAVEPSNGRKAPSARSDD